jgi:hypothetical protein
MIAVEPRLAIDAENPWPGLSAFDEAAERYFNGRQEEAAALRRLVAQGALSVLFGASGLGKTSLLKAGLFPLLRRDHVLPVYVRLDFRDLTAPLIDQVKLAFQNELRPHRVDMVLLAATIRGRREATVSVCRLRPCRPDGGCRWEQRGKERRTTPSPPRQAVEKHVHRSAASRQPPGPERELGTCNAPRLGD